jgi:pyrimidine-nucleoside phosphorylase
VDIITKKRDGHELSQAEIAFFVEGLTKGDIPDYQVAAWLMAIVWRGMTMSETVDLTMAMVDSGQTLDLSQVAPLVVDKHSSGGVGDKTTLVVAPVVAAWGMPVAKMSGRGLGFSGGTLDKIESIEGFDVDLDQGQFLANLQKYGIVLAGQTADLAPADGKLYALRDVTGTVESIPLIASSIMSKKIAAGAGAIVLDVKVGLGAFMKTLDAAAELAETMLQIGDSVGREVSAVLSAMDQPLGRAVGNALEVREAIVTLHGQGPDDFQAHCEVVAAEMLRLGGKCEDAEQGREMVRDVIADGRAWLRFRTLVEAQGGDVSQIENPAQLPQAPCVQELLSPREGYLSEIDAQRIGLAAVEIGAGRYEKGDPIDHAVGVVLCAKVGDAIQAGEPLLTIHANDCDRLASVKDLLLEAYSWSDVPIKPPPLIYQVMRETNKKS